jgi:hypothetical protein
MPRILRLSLCLWIASIAFSGCKTIVLHPMTEKDIRMEGNWVCMSPEYIQEVMKVKLEAKK